MAKTKAVRGQLDAATRTDILSRKSNAAQAEAQAAADREERLRSCREAAQLFKMLGDETRLRIAQVLTAGPMSVNRIQGAEPLDRISPPAISHHLGLMRHARVLQSKRDGKENIYSLHPENEPGVRAIVSSLLG